MRKYYKYCNGYYVAKRLPCRFEVKHPCLTFFFEIAASGIFFGLLLSHCFVF